MHLLNTRRRLAAFSSASVCALFLLTGCGGGTPGQDSVASADGTQAGMPARTSAQSYSSVDTSSFTLNSTAQFEGFNPQLWNGQKSWYECDCGRTSQPLPKSMPWNKAG